MVNSKYKLTDFHTPAEDLLCCQLSSPN